MKVVVVGDQLHGSYAAHVEVGGTDPLCCHGGARGAVDVAETLEQLASVVGVV